MNKRHRLIMVCLGVWLVSGQASTLADEPKPCKGTKRWYQGECRYPEEIDKMKKKARKKKAEASLSCKSFQDCVYQARDSHFGIGQKKNRRDAVRYLEAACRKAKGSRCGKEEALESCCRWLVLGGQEIRDVDFGTVLCEDACHKQERGDACVTLGMLRASLGRNDDAYKLFVRSCELRSPVGCSNQAVQKQFGRGTEREPLMARILFDKACELGYKPACHYKEIAQ